jgi:hypothetical protein
MIRTIFIAAALAVTLPAMPAQAQANRTFVSAAGSDSNNCAAVSTPCRHFQNAVNATALGGEVVALDPANYGSFTISQGITIQGQGWSYISPLDAAFPATGAAITINANASDNIIIRGVSLDGVGTSRTNGIVFNSGGSLTVIDCVAQNFNFTGASNPGNGIRIQPTSGTISFVIKSTIVANNGNAGISYFPPSGSTATEVTGVIDHVVAANNVFGIQIITGPGGPLTTVAISNGVASNNTDDGIDIQNASATPAALAVSIDNTSVSGNVTNGIEARNTPTVYLGRSVITGNGGPGTFNGTSPNTFYSFLDNRIYGNGVTSGGGNISGPLNSLALE